MSMALLFSFEHDDYSYVSTNFQGGQTSGMLLTLNKFKRFRRLWFKARAYLIAFIDPIPIYLNIGNTDLLRNNSNTEAQYESSGSRTVL